jgi:hypothetical protein
MSCKDPVETMTLDPFQALHFHDYGSNYSSNSGNVTIPSKLFPFTRLVFCPI